MKRIAVLIAALFIAFIFSCLLVRNASLEREIARQREQMAEMRETTTQARVAFKRMHFEYSVLRVLYMRDNYNYMRDSNAVYTGPIPDTEATKSLDASIKALEVVSK